MSEADGLDELSPEEAARLKRFKKRVQAGYATENLISRVSPDDPITRGEIVGKTSQGHDVIEPPKTT